MSVPLRNPAARISALPAARVAVVGDAILDHYVYGSVNRISPEAPIPVLRMDNERAMLGGAGNVARNISSLGAHVSFTSVVGRDAAGMEIGRLLASDPLIAARLLTSSGRTSSTKTRFVAGTHQLLRTDRESISPIDQDDCNDIKAWLADVMANCNSIVLSDYDKGVLTEGLSIELIKMAQAAGRVVIVDPKGRNYAKYRGADVLTPNLRELEENTGLTTRGDQQVWEACRALIAATNVGAVLATRGAEGMTLVQANCAPIHLTAHAVDVFDVSGAGDTVVAVLAAALASGAELVEAAMLANLAAGIVVSKRGTATCSLGELQQAASSAATREYSTKVVDRAQATSEALQWRAMGLKVGFANGCFDLLHPGHVALVRQARGACDRLIVGLNSDSSVRRIKGASRPISPEGARAAVMAALHDVDLVTVFEEDTPLDLILAVRPDVLVKGSDYHLEDVVGAKEVTGWGGKVLLAELAQGFSTSDIVARIAK